MTICNKYNPEVISSFVDRALDINMCKEIDKHLQTCPSCRELTEYYKAVDHIFEKRIYKSLSDLDLSSSKVDIMKQIQSESTVFKNKSAVDRFKMRSIQNQTSTFLEIIRRFMPGFLPVKVNKALLQVTCCAIVIFFSVILFKNNDFFSNNNKIVASLQPISPNAIVTSVNGNVSSLMILESEDKNMTIIWYKEV